METTYVMVKPDGVQAVWSERSFKDSKRKGLQLVGLKQVILSEEIAKEHYAVHAERPFFPGLIWVRYQWTCCMHGMVWS